MEEIEIIKPDDWHVHFRDNEIMRAVIPETSRYFARAIIMPNLTPPITKGVDAINYKDRIIKSIPKNHDFTPFMTLYLTENTNISDLEQSYKNGHVFAAKLYPAGATTNSESGVKDIKNIMPILEKMAKIGMPLLIHGEVTDPEIDIFDREKVFIDTTLSYIIRKLPELKITLEHITTTDSVSYVKEGNKNLAASITPHHLALDRNAIFVGGIKPHNYCLPILKRKHHRKALVKAAVSGISKFFLGTDTAPHLQKDKENSCGCAGIFNSKYCMAVLAEIFDKHRSIEKLESFTSLNGAKHYNLTPNKKKIRLIKKKKSIRFLKSISLNDDKIIIFEPNFPVYWKVKN